MSNKYVWSDLHVGHRNISKFRREVVLEDPCSKWTPEAIATDFRPKNEFRYRSSEEQHEARLEALCKLNKKDMCFLLGDIAFSEEWLNRLKEVPCRLILVAGNHDLELTKVVQSGAFEKVFGFTLHKGHWLSHAPIHPDELRGRPNVHGHLHYHMIQDERYRNVCVEYAPDGPLKWDYAISEEYYQECLRKYKYEFEGGVVNADGTKIREE